MRLLFQALGILTVGMLVRYRQGPSMFDPFFFIPFSCLSVILVGPILIELRRRSKDAVTIQIRRAVTNACASMALVLLFCVLSINLAPWRGEWILPELTTVVDAAALSLAATTTMAAIMGLLLWRLPAGAAKWFFRGFLLCALLLYRNANGHWSTFTIETVLSYGISTVTLAVAAALALISFGLLKLLARVSPPLSQAQAAGNKI